MESNPGYEHLSASGAGEYVLQHVPETWQKMMQTNYSNGIERDPERLAANDLDPTKWTNPLEIRLVDALSYYLGSLTNDILGLRLPNAPSMKIFCVYGHGKDTEVRTISRVLITYILRLPIAIILVCDMVTSSEYLAYFPQNANLQVRSR